MDVPSEFSERVMPRGTTGVVIECYEAPERYAVDLAIPDPSLVGGSAYENVILLPNQFEIINEEDEE